MGRASRPTPKRLAEKLFKIRQALDLSQNQLIQRLNYEELDLSQGSISNYERGTREPPLTLLLRYAQLADISVDLLIDDNVSLPERLPNK